MRFRKPAGKTAGVRTLCDALRHVADCRAPTHPECPTFRALLRTASRRPLAYTPSRPDKEKKLPSRRRKPDN